MGSIFKVCFFASDIPISSFSSQVSSDVSSAVIHSRSIEFIVLLCSSFDSTSRAFSGDTHSYIPYIPIYIKLLRSIFADINPVLPSLKVLNVWS